MLNLLYVEDDAGSRNVLTMVQRMNPGSFELITFENSSDFEQRLLQLDPPPDLILLDIHVKPYSGFEMLKMIDRHTAFAQTPVVALTASVMNEEIQLLQEAGFHSVVAKPLNLDEFPNLIERIMAGEKIWYIY